VPAAAAVPPASSAAPAPSGSTASSAAPAPAVQELRTYQDEDGYGPADARILPGIPTRWTIDSRSSATCASFVVVPSLNIQLALQPGDNVIELPALAAGTLDYTCGMGMYRGSISIENQPAS
jgi:plastocyanin domain-containing protein